MASALLNVFDANVTQLILDLVPVVPEFEDLAGCTTIYETKHYVTYTGGPEGGYVYFYKEREPGWYTWHREALCKPEYTMIEKGQVCFLIHDDGSEQIGVLPDSWDEVLDVDSLAESVIIADDHFMQHGYE